MGLHKSNIVTLKDKNEDFSIKWKIISKEMCYNIDTEKCHLCTREKLEIMDLGRENGLNERSDTFNVCLHRWRFMLSNHKPNTRQRVVPDIQSTDDPPDNNSPGDPHENEPDDDPVSEENLGNPPSPSPSPEKTFPAMRKKISSLKSLEIQSVDRTPGRLRSGKLRTTSK